MRLVNVQVKNFKLLENVNLQFSTDSSRPLTVIRAENGSGKTSLMHALLWAFYGMAGLPEHAIDLRLTSSVEAPGHAVNVSVMVEFEHTDDDGSKTQYRLIRTVSETPEEGDSVSRTGERVRLLRITSAGEEDIAEADALIGKFVPKDLLGVFFTNGDDVQRFITGKGGPQQRQKQVHRSIELLLGLEALRVAKKDIESVYKNSRAEAAKSAGANVASAEDALEKTDNAIADIEQEKEQLSGQLANMNERKVKWDKELTALHGIGNIDDLNERIATLSADVERIQNQRSRSLSRMRELLQSEESSWALLDEKLEAGVEILRKMADRRIIPGTSVEVLTDRLDLGICICGEQLTEGCAHTLAVEKLREEQREVSEEKQRLTALWHTGRLSKASHDARVEAGKDFAAQRKDLLGEFTEARDQLAIKGTALKTMEDKRKQIDDERVKALVESISKVDGQISDANTRLAGIIARIDQLSEIRKSQDDLLKEAEKSAKLSLDKVAKRDVAEDLLALAAGTLAVLEGDYVKKVSERMSELFMEMVGSDEDSETGVFKGVHIEENFDIVVDTHDGRKLDPDFELNGASQRALTLSFIWALMEVSGTTAPRIIDSPLGMTAGGVKTRMVDLLTRPPTEGMPDFQVILLLTRSEVRDVEVLLDDRAGKVHTMSCSKDYPKDLVYDWDVDKPIVVACNCSYRVSCRICARNYDDQHGVEFREAKTAV